MSTPVWQRSSRMSQGIISLIFLPLSFKHLVTKKNITHDNYKEVLFNNKQMQHTMKTIRSKNHQLGSFELNKISLSCFDDKRFIHENGITSYAYGHYKI